MYTDVCNNIRSLYGNRSCSSQWRCFKFTAIASILERDSTYCVLQYLVRIERGIPCLTLSEIFQDNSFLRLFTFEVKKIPFCELNGGSNKFSPSSPAWCQVQKMRRLSSILGRCGGLIIIRHWEFTEQSYLRTVPTISKVFLPWFMIMQEMQILTSGIKIQKENWGQRRIFFKDNDE